jgi:putative redox protein
MANKHSEKITFVGADGESELAARLDLPAGKPRAFALFAHCFTCTKDIFAASRIAEGLTDHGVGVLRFDFTGLGASEGEFANTSFSSNIGDLLAAAEWLRARHEAPKILVGHSLGGAAVLAAAASVPEAKAVCTIAAPADPGHVRHLFQGNLADIEANGEAEVLIAGRPFRVAKQFLDDIGAHKLEDAIAKLRVALLVFHAPLDNIVGIDNATRIFVAAKHPKSFVSLDDADHLLSRREDAVYVADVIAAWAGRYVGAVEQATLPELTAAEGTVVVGETGEGKFAQVISVGGKHTLLADEPVTYGGADTGPAPYDFLLAGLGACTTMTMRMYAERKGLPLERALVTLKHGKVYAEDCEHCETETGKIDRIEREVELLGPLGEADRRKLLEIADKCPVHRTLHSEVWVETRLKPAP